MVNHTKLVPKRVVCTVVGVLLIVLLAFKVITPSTQLGWYIFSLSLSLLDIGWIGEYLDLLKVIFIAANVGIARLILQAAGKVKRIQALVYMDAMRRCLLIYLAAHMSYVFMR